METFIVYVFVMLWLAVLGCVLLALLDLDHQLIDQLHALLEAILPTAGGDL